MNPVSRFGPTRLRLFVALPVTVPIAESAFALLPSELVALRRVRPEHMHVTLAFLGDTPAERLAEVVAAAREAARELAPFAVRLDRIDAFRGRRGPGTIWLGIGAGAANVEDLASRVRRALGARGLSFDPKPVHSHLTLARVRSESPEGELRAVAAALEGIRVATALTLPVEALAVIESTLSSGGPRHALRASIPLGTDPHERRPEPGPEVGR